MTKQEGTGRGDVHRVRSLNPMDVAAKVNISFTDLSTETLATSIIRWKQVTFPANSTAAPIRDGDDSG